MKVSRRRVLKWAGAAAAGAVGTAVGWSFWEPRWPEVTAPEIFVPRLPAEFDGLRIALVADVHHGRHFSLERVRRTVRCVNELRVDVVALCGDYVTGREARGGVRIAPSVGALSELRAELGVFAVLGNHDEWADADLTRQHLKRAGITDLTNTGVWLRRREGRLWLAGAADVWTERPDLGKALAGVADTDVVVLMTHNPDYVEGIRDSRIGLVLSGHTHGGQVWLPFLGAPIVPSNYGQKYRAGLVKTPWTQVYVTRGLGVVGPPVRLLCRPELPVITLRRSV